MYHRLFHEGVNETMEDDQGIQIHDSAGLELTMFDAKRESKLSEHQGNAFEGQLPGDDH